VVPCSGTRRGKQRPQGRHGNLERLYLQLSTLPLAPGSYRGIRNINQHEPISEITVDSLTTFTSYIVIMWYERYDPKCKSLTCIDMKFNFLWCTLFLRTRLQQLSYGIITITSDVEEMSWRYNHYIWCGGNATTQFKKPSHGHITITSDVEEM